MPKPPLLLDVDGVLNVFPRSGLLAMLLGREPEPGAAPNLEEHRAAAEDGTVYTLRIRPEYGGWLRSLAETYELVWSTTWGPTANERISPLLGLPGDLDVVPMPGVWMPHHEPVEPSVSRKAPWIREWAELHGVERLAWLDDEIEDGDPRALTAAGTPVVAALTLPVDPFEGLARRHLEALAAWADSGFAADWEPH
jgi:hypothetical protein